MKDENIKQTQQNASNPIKSLRKISEKLIKFKFRPNINRLRDKKQFEGVIII